MAPAASRARWTPNDVARRSGTVLSAISVSRGAVRIPFPSRSPVTTAASGAHRAPTSSRPSLDTAETAYPTTATDLYRRSRSETTPLPLRTSVEALAISFLNAYLEAHSWEEYGEWHLGLTDGPSDDTKARYAFVYGDLRRLHRTGLIACHYRAAEWRHKEIELAAHDLLQLLDERSA